MCVNVCHGGNVKSAPPPMHSINMCNVKCSLSHLLHLNSPTLSLKFTTTSPNPISASFSFELFRLFRFRHLALPLPGVRVRKQATTRTRRTSARARQAAAAPPATPRRPAAPVPWLVCRVAQPPRPAVCVPRFRTRTGAVQGQAKFCCCLQHSAPDRPHALPVSDGELLKAHTITTRLYHYQRERDRRPKPSNQLPTPHRPPPPALHHDPRRPPRHDRRSRPRATCCTATAE